MAMRKTRAGTTNVGIGTVETEIERAREEGNWKRVAELAEQLRQRPERQCETLANFLIGEAKLEDFLEEYPPKEKNASAAKEGLQEARECLMRTIGDDAKKLGVHLDSYILLGKLNYAMSNFTEALRFYERAQLDTLEEKQLPARSLKIMAEAFAIRALCYEKASANRSTSKAKAAEREETITRWYEVAGDLTLLFLQVSDKSSNPAQSTWSVTSSSTAGGAVVGTGGASVPNSSSPLPPTINSSTSSAHKLGPILEMALLKAPTLDLKAGNTMRAVSRFRAILQAEESESTKEIRRNVCWKLAEVLLHGVSDLTYVPPEDPVYGGGQPSSTRPRMGSAAVLSASARSAHLDSPWKPRKHTGANLWVPRTRLEEIVLLLLLSENMARKEAILSQAPEFFGMRSTKFRDAIITYDLATVALARARSFRVLCRMLEHSMKFSFNEPHTWTQFGLALASEGKFYRSLQVFRELAVRNQADCGTCLCVAKMCYERLHMYEEGLEWAERAQKKDDSLTDHLLRTRCNIYRGLGCLLRARTAEDLANRREFLARAEERFLTARKSDLDDHLAEYYLAYYYAVVRETAKAMAHVRRALDLHPEHLASMHLLALLLSAQNQYSEALELVDIALEEFPENLPVMSLKVYLEEKVNGGEMAVLVAKAMLEQWQAVCDQLQSEEESNSSSHAPAGAAPASLVNNPLGAFVGSAAAAVVGPTAAASNYDTLSTLRGGVAAAAAATTAGGAGNISANSTVVVPGVGGGSGGAFDTLSDKDSVSLHAQSLTASHVEKTLSEVASSVSAPFPRPGPHDPLYTQMRIWLLTAELHLNENNVWEAEQCVGEARMISPLSYHLMHAKGRLHESKGDFDLARQCYESSLGINPSHVASLHHLGQVNYYLGHFRSAEQALKVACRLEPNDERLWSLLGEVTESLAGQHLEQVDEISHGSVIREEKDRTPTEDTSKTLVDEATRLFATAAECHSIALSLQAASPILPYTTIPLCFE